MNSTTASATHAEPVDQATSGQASRPANHTAEDHEVQGQTVQDRTVQDRTAQDRTAQELVAGLPSAQLEQRLLQAHRATEVGHRLLAFYLHDMQTRGVHQVLGFRSAAHFAMERLDMCRAKAHKLVAVGSALRGLRVVDHAFATGQVSWSKVTLLCRVATEDTEREWVLKAQELAYRQLEWLVRSSAPGDRPPKGGGGLAKVKFHVHAELGALEYEIWEQAKRKLAEERGTSVGDADLIIELGRIPVDGSCFQVMVDPEAKTVQTEDGPVPLSDGEMESVVSDATPQLTKGQRNRILTRDGQRCRCCGSRRSLQVHHIRFVSHGGKSTADNLLTLCSYCHGRIHEGFLRIRAGQDGRPEFQDRRGRLLQGRLPGLESTDYVHSQHVHSQHEPAETNPTVAKPVNQDVIDRDFVLQNMDRLRWRGGRMVLV